MLVHGRAELIALADQCVVRRLEDSNGWRVDAWHMDDADVEDAISVYQAVLAGDATDPVLALLTEAGVDLETLLIDSEHAKADITRSDLTELTAAASLIAAPGCDVDLMHMPNVPKMSRRKSDSGIDIFMAVLNRSSTAGELQNTEHLTIASVKHTVDETSARGIRWKLAKSLSDKELSVPYLASQLRVLNARMQQEGLESRSAARVYLFLRDFPNAPAVDLFAIGVSDPDLETSMNHHVELLPEAGQSQRTFRIIYIPGLRQIHRRCP